MADLADGFIALPGGYGTFDELFEIVTWAQLGIHAKPIGLLDVRDYFATLMALVERAAQEGFVPPAHTALLLRADTPTEMLDRLAAFQSIVNPAPSEPPPQR